MSLDGACAVADRGVIRASGPDAGSFLQGQLTNDVLGLTAGARPAGFCSAKGRLQASFVVCRSADDYLLVCHASVLAATLKRLSMFVLRAKCKLTDASDQLSIEGLVGPTASDALGAAPVWSTSISAGRLLVRLPDAEGHVRGWRIGPRDDASAAPNRGDGEGSLDPLAWRWLDVRSGLVTIEAATVDRFVPQMVNYELVGGVDFKKGCYPGQEVVARSQYRGTIKRRTFLFDLDGDREVAAGADVFDAASAQEPVGTVANAAAHPAGGPASALVELRLGALDIDLRAGGVDGARLVRASLPYPLPTAADAAA